MLLDVFLDGKTYDAFLMCYKSDTDAGINACDRKCLENVLEERFGYNLCLYDRDVLPGKGMALPSKKQFEENLPKSLNEILHNFNFGLLQL